MVNIRTKIARPREEKYVIMKIVDQRLKISKYMSKSKNSDILKVFKILKYFFER